MTIGSLFSGIGGLERGLEMCGLGPVLWQCDSDPCARAVLEEHWPGVRRYEDVRHIDERAERADVICGGFPCQPVSLAGKRKAQGDTRWLWPFMATVIDRLRPSVVFIENVPGLLRAGLHDVLADLASLGFDAEWGGFTAAEVGAPHRRQRIFILAHAHGEGQLQQGRSQQAQRGRLSDSGGHETRAERETNAWAAEPDVGRVAYGVSARVDRLRLLGNAVVPQQAALAWRTLSARVMEAQP